MKKHWGSLFCLAMAALNVVACFYYGFHWLNAAAFVWCVGMAALCFHYERRTIARSWITEAQLEIAVRRAWMEASK